MRPTLRLAAALLTFVVGTATTTVWLLYDHSPLHKLNGTDADLIAINASQDSPASMNSCRWNNQIAQVLPQLYSEYTAIEKSRTVGKLVVLDEKVRQFINSRPEDCFCGDDAKHWDAKYAKLGLHLGYHGLLGYSGVLLVEAHRINPKSEYREYTLFSTIMGVRSYHGLGEMPNIKAASRYAREFADGPFAEETLSILADFHKDLFMVLRDDLRDYKYDCFKSYIDESPYLKQMNRAKGRAMSYYEKVIAINPSNTRAKDFLSQIDNAKIESWSFCAD